MNYTKHGKQLKSCAVGTVRLCVAGTSFVNGTGKFATVPGEQNPKSYVDDTGKDLCKARLINQHKTETYYNERPNTVVMKKRVQVEVQKKKSANNKGKKGGSSSGYRSKTAGRRGKGQLGELDSTGARRRKRAEARRRRAEARRRRAEASRRRAGDTKETAASKQAAKKRAQPAAETSPQTAVSESTPAKCGRIGPDQCTPWTFVAGIDNGVGPELRVLKNRKLQTEKLKKKIEGLTKYTPQGQDMLSHTFAHLAFGTNDIDRSRFCILTMSQEEKKVQVGEKKKTVRSMMRSFRPVELNGMPASAYIL